MEAAKFVAIIILAATIAVSGCTMPGNSSDNTGDSSSTGEGLKVLSFHSADTQLLPGQKTVLTLKLENQHIRPVNVQKMRVYNTGFLELKTKGSWENRCTPSDLGTSQRGLHPKIECKWVVQAPENIDPIKSKTVNPRLQLVYDSEVSNKANPMVINFRDYTEINDTEEVTETYSNKEVSLKVNVDNPVPLDAGTKISLKINNGGTGKVISDYNLETEPSSVFGPECSSKTLEPVIEDEVEHTCEIDAGSSNPVARNLIISTSYKYQKSPSLNIEVVNK